MFRFEFFLTREKCFLVLSIRGKKGVTEGFRYKLQYDDGDHPCGRAPHMKYMINLFLGCISSLMLVSAGRHSYTSVAVALLSVALLVSEDGQACAFR